MTDAPIGRPISRVDGRAKVTGEAKYAAEFDAPGLAYGYVVSSEVARGKILRIDASEALALPGVLRVFTHENAPRLARFDSSYRDEVAPKGSPFRPLHDAEIQFSGQPVALVVAETFELARYAATLVAVEYRRDDHETDLDASLAKAYKPKARPGIKPPPSPRGHAARSFSRAAVPLEAVYVAPAEHHNPIEMFATTVVHGEDGTLTVHDKTQGCQNVQQYLCNVFGYSAKQLRVISPYVGGAFGSGLRPVYQAFLAVLAARELKRSVRLVLTRQQMFTFGHRPATWQRVSLGAAADGTLESVAHEAIGETSRSEDFTEAVVNWSGLLYKCENVRLEQKVVALDFATPLDMRAPGALWGLFAIESAIDELAVKLGIDPVDLRLKNYAERDENEGKPFSSKELRECYRQAGDRFGWSRRDPTPRSMRRGESLVGWGMAGGVWESPQQKASAGARIDADGKATVASATADIGTGTYTIMTQIAAETLGLPIEDVTFQLGDSSLPTSPVEGGSWTASSVGSAVKVVCEELREKVFKLAKKASGSPLAHASLDEVGFADGKVFALADPSRAVSFVEAIRGGKLDAVEAEASSGPSAAQQHYSRHSHSAVFAEVEVDEDLGTVRVSRVVSAIAGGRVLNPKTARSQILGGIVWGIGAALQEESVVDQAFGRFVNHDLSEYHVPVAADIREIEVIFVEERDEFVNPLGAKGLGEIGLVGVAAAIANAVYHATGKRIRDLPITLDKLL